MTEQVIETTEQAVEVLEDRKAGIEPQSHEPEPRRNIRGPEEALAVMKEDAEAGAEVQRREEINETSLRNQKEQDSSFTLSENHASQVSLYQKAAQEFVAEKQALTNALSRIDREKLQKLRNESPSEFLALRQEVIDRQAKLENTQNQLLNAAGQIQTAIASEVLEKERAKMVKAEPALAEPGTLQKVQRFLLNNGYSVAEIESMTDSRSVVAAYRAMEHAESKRIRSLKIPKRKGSSGTPRVKSETTLLKERLRKSGSVSDAVAVLNAKKNPSKPQSAAHRRLERQAKGPLSLNDALSLYQGSAA